MFGIARWRLVAWNVCVLTVILLLLEALVYIIFSRQVYSGADTELRVQEHRALAAMSSPNGVSQLWIDAAKDITYRTVVVTPTGASYSTECPQQQGPSLQPCQVTAAQATDEKAIMLVRRTGNMDISTASFEGHPQRVITFIAVQTAVATTGQQIPVPYIVQISRTAAGESEAMNNLSLLLVLAGLMGIILSAVGSLFLANRALIPIRQAFSRQRQFTADASHELRTPLALIRANAEMLGRHAERLPPQDEELITEIIKETDHLNRLVSDLLTLARADTEMGKIEPRPVDFRALVSEVHEDLQRIAESRGIASSISLNGPATVPGDEVRLRQLLLILLDNALKYTDPGGRVDISLARQDNQARLVVSDTGIGIPEKDRTRIFDRFYRVDQARQHESGGTGLGLAIAKWIVQAHNGSIKVDSELGRGSKFEVNLPAS